MAESICFLSVCVSLCQWANWLVCVFPWVCVCLCVFLLPLPGRWKTDAQPGKCRWAHRQTKSHVNTQASTLTLTQPGKRAGEHTDRHKVTWIYRSCAFQFGCCFQSWKCDQRYLTVVAVHLWLTESEPAPPVLGDVPSLLHGTCGCQQQLWRTQMGNLHLLKGTSYSLLFLIKFNLHTNFYVCVLVNHYLCFGFVSVFIWGCAQVYLSTSVRHDRTLRLFCLHLCCDTKQTAPRTPEMCVNVTCTFVSFLFSSSQTKNSHSQSRW